MRCRTNPSEAPNADGHETTATTKPRIRATDAGFDTQTRLRDDLLLFLPLAAIGLATGYVGIDIPHADTSLEARLAFGMIGFALLSRVWLAGALALVLFAPEVHGMPPDHAAIICLLASMSLLAITRFVYTRWLSGRRAQTLVAHGLAWFGLVTLCCYALIIPASLSLWALHQGLPLLETVLDRWFEQHYLIESLLIALVSTSVMIAARSRADIAHSQNEMHVTLQSIGDAVIATDTAGRVTRMNGEASRLTGWQEEEATGRQFGDIMTLVNSRTRVSVASPIQHVLREGKTVGLANHTTLISRTGREWQIADSAAPIRNSDGHLLGIVMVFRDVTEEYAAREVLAHRKRQLDLALDAAGMGIWDWEIANNRVEWIGHQAALFGIRPEDFDGSLTSTQALVHPDDWDMTIAGALATSRDGADYDQTFRTVWPDGSLHRIRAVAKLIRDDDGKPWRVIGTAQDITDQKLAEERLLATVDALSRSNVELERFAYVASHDLQEPIRSMVAYSQLLGQRYGDSLDADAKAFLGFIIQGAKRMQALVLDLLEYSQASAGGRPFAPVDMREVVSAACANLTQAIADSKANIQVEEMPTVLGDESQLVSLMQNLIGNAVKFHLPGVSPCVTLSAHIADCTATIEVADNGIGIDPVDQSKVFEIFKRLHTPQDYPGTGVGLSLAVRIIERHGGAIHLDSALGQGSRFRVTLPMPPTVIA